LWVFFFVVCKFWIYSTVFTPHIDFIILISMIAGNLDEIQLPKKQQINVFGSLILTRLDRRGYQPTTCLNPRNFSFHDVWKVLFHLNLSYLWSFVSCGVFSLCNLLLSVSRAAPLTLKKLVNGSDLFYVGTASLIRLSIIERITVSVKRKTDLKLFCYNHLGCVCSVNYRRFIQNKTHLVKR
jgi:hypothetical protein